MAIVRTQAGGGVVTSTPAAQKRMLLSAIKKSEKSTSEKILLYGPEGWGKNTWAAGSEKPIFLSTEDGMKTIPGQDMFPEVETWPDMLDAIDTLRLDSHEFKTVVIDTADWSEQLSHLFVCKRDNKESIVDYGYGNGYNVAFDEWKKLIHALGHLKKEKDMNIIFLAHSDVRTFKNPMGEDYDRYELKTHKFVSALLKEWSDDVLFGTYDVDVNVKKNRKGESLGKGKAYGHDERIIHLTHNAAWDAKNRHHIREPLAAPFEAPAQSFWDIVKGEKK